MLTYELVLLYRQMLRPELKQAVKRSAELIFDRGGFIRKVDYMGLRDLPYKISKNQVPHRKAEYFTLTFNIGFKNYMDLKEDLKLDVDIMRSTIFKIEEVPSHECTLEEEMKPVAFRKDVQKLLKLQDKQKKKTWAPQMGIDYYPFQR